MTIHLRRHDFNNSVRVPPRVRQKPPEYAVELLAPAHIDDKFVKYALRLIWTKINTAAYREAVKNQFNPAYRDHSQYDALLKVKELCREGHTVVGHYPSRDVAETKVQELNAQFVYGCQLPARAIKLS